LEITSWFLTVASFDISEDFGGYGNSYHGTGGRGNKRAQMRYCLRLIRSIVSTGQETVLQDLADQGAINQISSEYHTWVG
jgi:hypothetical protein